MTDIVPTTGGARGAGLATFSDDGRVLDTWYLQPELGDQPATGTEAVSPGAIEDATGVSANQVVGRDEVRHVVVQGVHTTIADLQAPPVDTHDVYLRLHLLSHRLVRPNTINLEGIFGLLDTVAWTQLGPVAVDELPAAQPPGARGRHAPRGAVARQVPADARLRGAVGGAHRRRQSACASAPTWPRAPR